MKQPTIEQLLTDAILEAIRSAKAAEEYARSLGYPIRFSSRDIQKMAIAILRRNPK